MSEPDISTLARRLAEQNNVDWRALSGSGPDGKVVERDVLDFLARVMAGDEAVDPTPEPVPEGMEAWPEQDIQGFRAAVSETPTLGELRDDIGQASRDYVAPPEPVVSSTAAGDDAGTLERPVTATIDEDIFLFDDDEPVATPEPVEPAEAVPAAAAVDDLDDLLVAGDDDGDFAVAADAADTVTGATHDSRFGAVTAGFVDDADEATTPRDDAYGSSSVTDSHERDDGFGATDTYAATTSPTDADVTAADDGAVWGSDISLGDRHPVASGAEADVPELWGPESTAEPEADLWTDTADAAAGSDDVVEPFQVGEETGETFSDDYGDAEPFTTERGEDAFVSGEGDASATVEDEPETDVSREFEAPSEPVDAHSADAESEPFSAPAFEGVPAGSGTVDAGLAAVGATVLSAETANLPLARPGTILRRNIDVSPLAAAQLAVGQELGYDEPLAASVFLLRAVAKAAASTSMGAGSVGLALLSDDVVIRRVEDAATMSFGALVGGLDGVADGDATGDDLELAAADLSGLDVDEAVLELDVPVISLGRILYDNQRGAYKSTLTLTGPMPLDSAARLLARVAELLDSPVRLML